MGQNPHGEGVIGRGEMISDIGDVESSFPYL
jgi:hypothetical protein